jgi:hypothetical protein
MSDNSFTNEKNLIFTITLATGNFQGTDGNTATISNFRATADIDHAGGMMMSAARFKIYGLGAPLMNQLTTIAWLSFGVLKNTIQVQAVDGDVKTTVFQGTIINSWADYSSAPDVFLYIESQAGFFNQIQSVPPTSYPHPSPRVGNDSGNVRPFPDPVLRGLNMPHIVVIPALDVTVAGVGRSALV